MKNTLIVSAIASFALIAGAFAQTQSPAAAPQDTVVTAPESTAPPPPAKAPKSKAQKSTATKAKAKVNAGYPFRGKLKAFDKDALTFTVAGKDKDRVVHITSQTRFIKDGKPATLSDAIIGGEVAGTVRKVKDGKEEAVSVRFGPAPKAGKSAEKSVPKKAPSKPGQAETQ